MKLARALSEKNRLIRKIRDIQNKITVHNSYIKGNAPIYESINLMAQLNAAIGELTTLKAKICKANSPIQDKIFQLAELKSLAAFLKALQIKEGKVIGDSWRNTEVMEWESQLGNLERDKRLENIEKEIDTLQAELDKFNFETEIGV